MATHTILVIDDSRTVLLRTRRALELAGYQVITLNTAVGAVRQIRLHRPDLVLLDLSMPELDGEELLRVVERFGILPELTVLLYSDQSEETLRDVATRSGAHGYIQKSSDEELVDKVNEWMQYQWPF